MEENEIWITVINHPSNGFYEIDTLLDVAEEEGIIKGWNTEFIGDGTTIVDNFVADHGVEELPAIFYYVDTGTDMELARYSERPNGISIFDFVDAINKIDVAYSLNEDVITAADELANTEFKKWIWIAAIILLLIIISYYIYKNK